MKQSFYCIFFIFFIYSIYWYKTIKFEKISSFCNILVKSCKIDSICANEIVLFSNEKLFNSFLITRRYFCFFECNRKKLRVDLKKTFRINKVVKIIFFQLE